MILLISKNKNKKNRMMTNNSKKPKPLMVLLFATSGCVMSDRYRTKWSSESALFSGIDPGANEMQLLCRVFRPVSAASANISADYRLSKMKASILLFVTKLLSGNSGLMMNQQQTQQQVLSNNNQKKKILHWSWTSRFTQLHSPSTRVFGNGAMNNNNNNKFTNFLDNNFLSDRILIGCF